MIPPHSSTSDRRSLSPRWVCLLSPTFTHGAAAHLNCTLISLHAGTNDQGIGVEPAFFVEAMRAFVTRLVEVYHETLAHICILVRCFLIFLSCFEIPFLVAAPFPVLRLATAIWLPGRVYTDRRAGDCGSSQYWSACVGFGGRN